MRAMVYNAYHPTPTLQNHFMDNLESKRRYNKGRLLIENAYFYLKENWPVQESLNFLVCHLEENFTKG